MKNRIIKLFAVLFSIVIVFTLCSCKVKDEISQVSSTPTTSADSQPLDNNASNTLLSRMYADNDLNNIKNITISLSTCVALSPLTDKEDMEFLQKYTYSHYRTDKRENWDGWLKDNSDLSLTVMTENLVTTDLYLMKDGSIAIAQMCGDSEVPEISYDFYTADKADILTKEKLELLSNKEN